MTKKQKVKLELTRRDFLTLTATVAGSVAASPPANTSWEKTSLIMVAWVTLLI